MEVRVQGRISVSERLRLYEDARRQGIRLAAFIVMAFGAVVYTVSFVLAPASAYRGSHYTVIVPILGTLWMFYEIWQCWRKLRQINKQLYG